MVYCFSVQEKFSKHRLGREGKEGLDNSSNYWLNTEWAVQCVFLCNAPAACHPLPTLIV